MLAGRQHINSQQNAMLAGIGHDTTSANTNITAVGEWSKLNVADAGNILFAVGNGSSATNRSNAFVVSENYTYVNNELRLDELKNNQGLLKVGQYGAVSTATAGTDYVAPSTTVNGKALSSNIALTASDVGALADTVVVPSASSTAPMMDGTAAAGTGTTWARADHVHPVDTSRAAATHNHAAGDINSGTLGVARGGTGAGTFTSGAALIGNGTGAFATRSITNNTAATTALTASTNLVTMNTLRYALNRTTGPGTADTNYTTAMMRAIKASTTDLTAGSSSLTSGQIYLVYEA